MEATLQAIYDEENAPSANQLYTLARKAGHAYTKEKVDDFVKRQATAQILTAKKAPSRVVGKFQATRQNEKWQMDLLDRSTKPSELDGKRQTYVLAIVDVFTRRGYLEPMVDKKKKTVLEAYKRITERAGAFRKSCRSIRKERRSAQMAFSTSSWMKTTRSGVAPRVETT